MSLFEELGTLHFDNIKHLSYKVQFSFILMFSEFCNHVEDGSSLQPTEGFRLNSPFDKKFALIILEYGKAAKYQASSEGMKKEAFS